jgi:hypothetical protein
MKQPDLDPHAERELAAIDDALAGRPLDPGLAGVEELTSLLAEERPAPDESWAAELDRRAADRFRPERGSGSWRDGWERLRALPPRRIAAPAGALATLAVAAIVAASTMSGGGSDSASVPITQSTTAAPEAAGVDGGIASSDSARVQSGGAYPLRRYNAGTSKLSPGTEQRKVDRDVSMQLSAAPDDVRDVTDEVISIARGAGGIVVSSQVTEQGRESAATLELSIPSGELDGAIDELSDLAHVDSLNETTQDITHPFVTARDDLRDAMAERKSLLQALESASTETETDALRAQIHDASERIARARARFENVARQARWSTVSVRVVADRDAPPAGDESGFSGWLDDAKHTLTDVAGVLLVTAAIVVPLGILFALGWLVVARARRHRRERALDS